MCLRICACWSFLRVAVADLGSCHSICTPARDQGRSFLAMLSRNATAIGRDPSKIGELFINWVSDQFAKNGNIDNTDPNLLDGASADGKG